MANTTKSSRIYECVLCNTRIPANTNGVFTRCSCGKIAIDGTYYYTRIIGNMKYAKLVSIDKNIYVYKLKHIGTGLYYKPSSYTNPGNLSRAGKVYTSKPSLKWVNEKLGEFIIQKYKLEITQ